jgi:hypothetical protein
MILLKNIFSSFSFAGSADVYFSSKTELKKAQNKLSMKTYNKKPIQTATTF